jgi:lipopolysaccharide exporter
MIAGMTWDHMRSRIREVATGGAASVAVSVALSNVLRIVSNVTLTRLLDPNAFGIVGIMVSVSVVFALISDIGVYDFVLQHRQGDEEQFRHEIWTIRLIRSAFLTLAMFVLSHPVAFLLGIPELAPIIAVWSFSFLIDGLSSLAFATAVRARQFWRIALLELIASVIQLIVAVAVAIVIRNYWAMITGMLVSSCGKTLLSYMMFPGSRRSFRWDRTRARELWGFSRYIALSSLLTLLVMQSDKLVLARLMPLAAYGLYAIATTLAAAPSSIAVPYATRVLLANYAQAARDGREVLAQVYYTQRSKAAVAYMFLCGGLIGGAPLLIAILYDPRYAAVTPYLRLLLISSALRLSTTAAKWALIALGYTRSTFYANLASTIWLAVGGAFTLWHGNVLGLVATVGTVEVPALLVFWWNLRREHILDLASEMIELAAGGVGMAIGYAAALATLALFPQI